MTNVPSYILERVRKPTPEDCFIIPGSTPVVSFGNVQTAQVATLGLNPSKREFASANGEWLAGKARRLATLQSLGVTSLAGANDEVIETVVDNCYRYFQRQPYMSWFGALETVLKKATGTSYFNNTACHLDLVQWATEPVWQHLPSKIRANLIKDDREFLARQIGQECIRLVLMNGRSVINQVAAMGVMFDRSQHMQVGKTKCDLVVGDKYGTTFLGWSINLQSSFGVSNQFKAVLAERVGRIVEHQG